MSKQQEKYTGFPMRPRQGTISAEDAFTCTQDDPDGGVDWTAAASVNLAVDATYCVDGATPITADANDDIVLDRGLWKFELLVPVIDDTGAADVQFALTNTGGTTVHGTSAIYRTLTGQTATIPVIAYAHITTDATVVKLRGASDLATTDIEDEAFIGTVTKIANVYEQS